MADTRQGKYSGHVNGEMNTRTSEMRTGLRLLVVGHPGLVLLKLLLHALPL